MRGRGCRSRVLGLLLVGLALGSTGAVAQDYPNKPVKWIVGYVAGGSTDILARIFAQWFSERLGQQFVVENRPGAGTKKKPARRRKPEVSRRLIGARRRSGK